MKMNSLDLSFWCSLIRTRRVKLGYRKAGDFCDYVYSLTSTEIKTQTFYKLEQGGQPPSVEQFFAINLACYGSLMPPKKILNCCISDSWKELLNDNEHHHDARNN